MSNVCIGCGVCCMSYRVAFHWSETTDHPDGRVPVALTEPLRRHEVVMRGTASSPVHCIALTGTVGIDARCAIHGTHPGCCQAVVVGADQCQRARAMHGLPAVTPAQVLQAYASDAPPAGHFPSHALVEGLSPADAIVLDDTASPAIEVPAGPQSVQPVPSPVLAQVSMFVSPQTDSD